MIVEENWVPKIVVCPQSDGHHPRRGGDQAIGVGTRESTDGRRICVIAFHRSQLHYLRPSTDRLAAPGAQILTGLEVIWLPPKILWDSHTPQGKGQ